MKPNFALSLSFEGLRLMHRTTGGWHFVGQVALDAPDLTGALADLRAKAEALDPAGLSTKLLIPNDQIKYLALDGTRAEDADVRAALDGATPYAVDELSYDFTKGGGRTYVAAVAQETLVEAQQFATEYGFNPVCFAAVPEPFTYMGEAFLGNVAGFDCERDADAVVVIGTADLPDGAVTEAAEPVPAADPVPAPEPEPEAEAEAEPVSQPEPEPEAEPKPAPEPVPPAEAEAPEPEPAQAPPAAVDVGGAAEAEKPVAEETAKTEPQVAAPDPSDATDPADAPAPAFSSSRTEPSLTRAAPLTATPSEPAAAPPLAAPSRAETAQSEPPKPLSTEPPAPTEAPPITGSAAQTAAPTAAPAVAAAAVPEPTEPEAGESVPLAAEEESAKASPARRTLGAASAVGGAVGGVFASRRMARAEAMASAADQEPEATEPRKTVFGARAKPKAKVAVGGKPRFLGLILTAILLLFMLAIAAFAALSEEGFARWFGFGAEDTQIAAPVPEADPVAEGATTETAVVPTPAVPSDVPDVSANDTLAAQAVPGTGTVLTTQQAERIYAATGVWQKAPRIPLEPRTTGLEALALDVVARPVVRVPASPLASASSVAGDAVIATPVNPPPPNVAFDFDADGRVVPTPEGAATPDGILVFAGRPPLNPPTRPGTVAPVVTPQDQLAALAPEATDSIDTATQGVVVIAGRPAISPPSRPQATLPETDPLPFSQVSDGAPLLATDGLVVLAGAPPALPPARPGTVAPSAEAAAPQDPVTPEAAEPSETAAATPSDIPEELPEGLNVILGAPPLLPPARPGTQAPTVTETASADDLSGEVQEALAATAVQAPTPETLRPLDRPESVVLAAAALNQPILGGLTRNEASGFRPQVRPAGLAPPPTPEPEPEPEPQQEAAAPAQTSLAIAPEIAAAVEAAANRPDPFASATAQAVARSERPDARPRNMARIVERAQAAQTRVAAAAPRTVAPSGPTGSAVARNATLDNAINLRELNLIGIYGGSGDRRALVRLANGRYVRVTVGDRLDGGRVTAISSEQLSYMKRGRAITLEVAG